MVHLTTALEPGSGVPLYEQLYRSLAGEMRSGTLAAGTRMPGKRRLAAELAMRIKHSLNLKQALENEFLTLVRQAQLNNEIAKDAELIPDNSWVLVREAWCD